MIYNEIRRKTKEIKIGKMAIGGNNPIAIQSMTNTDTHDKEATLVLIRSLEGMGCDIVRITVPDTDAAETVSFLKASQVKIPIVADIHFDYKVALRCAELGVDKIRINPGNIGSQERVLEVVSKAKNNGIPIRVGVNAGSVSQNLLKQYGAPCAEALVEEALGQVRLLEACDFRDIVISLKASSVPMMIESYRLMAEKVDYPLHLGVTEAGTLYSGTIKSAVGIGALLSSGIGDTIRVSLTADPVEEIRAGKEILSALELKKDGARLVSCPTCARCTVDLIGIANQVTERLSEIKKPVKIAVMGCVVNGPGEARDADIGITGAKGEGLIFRKGEIIRRVPEQEIMTALFEELDKMGALA